MKVPLDIGYSCLFLEEQVPMCQVVVVPVAAWVGLAGPLWYSAGRGELRYLTVAGWDPPLVK